jgi:hypothetical protein
MVVSLQGNTIWASASVAGSWSEPPNITNPISVVNSLESLEVNSAIGPLEKLRPIQVTHLQLLTAILENLPCVAICPHKITDFFLGPFWNFALQFP